MDILIIIEIHRLALKEKKKKKWYSIICFTFALNYCLKTVSLLETVHFEQKTSWLSAAKLLGFYFVFFIEFY